MFWFRDETDRASVAFTDATLDLQGLRPGFPDELGRLVDATGVPGFARANQVHGTTVLAVDAPQPPDAATEEVPVADALLTRTPGLGLMVRVADCVPVVLLGRSTAAVVHAGRVGMVGDVVTRAVDRLREVDDPDTDGGPVSAWIGPSVCGACYEVPAALRDEVAAVEPSTRSTTAWGTPALDVAAGVRAQLERAGVADVVVVPGCTREEPRLHSYRRDGAASGRTAGLVWLR